MIKVLYLRSSFNPGGTETLLLNLFNYNQKAIQFFYILLSDGAYIEKLQSTSNIFKNRFRRSKFDLHFVSSIIKEIRASQIKIIHTHQPIELFYGLLIKMFVPGLKCFHTIHLYNASNDWKFKLEKLMVRFTKKTIVVSKSLRNKLLERGYNKNKLVVLNNAVILDEIVGDQAIENKKRFENLIKYSKKDYIIGMTGNFVPEKDQITIVKAYKRILKSQHTNVKLVLIGKASEITRSCIEELPPEIIGEKVFFTGALESANQYLNYFDLFVMSSKSETFGIVVIEALLKKVPVLASNIDTFYELSDNGKYFSLFKTSDDKDLADKIINRLNQNNTDFEGQLEESFSYANKQFTYKKYTSELVKIYSS